MIFLVWPHLSKVSFRDGHDKLALPFDLFFIAFFIYFCSLIFPWSLPSFRYFHTHSFPLICYSIPFTLLNITENSVAINKLNCGRRAFMRTLKHLISCSSVLRSITAFIPILRRWNIFRLQNLFFVLIVQIADLCCEVKIKNDIFVFLFGMFSEVMFL